MNPQISLGNATSAQGLAENISTKSKRGRPRSEWLDILGTLAPGQTRRSLNNHKSTTDALKVLKKHSAENYFHTPNKVRHTILAALGRIGDEDSLLFVANEIANDKMPTGTALKFIRAILTPPTSGGES